MSTIRIPQFCIALALCGGATPALADWTGKGNIGASFATGNSENQAASAALELKNTVDNWPVHVRLCWQLRQRKRQHHRPALGIARADPVRTDRARIRFGAGRYEDDRFSQYDYQASLAGGLGYKIIDTERTKFWVQGGPGYRYAEIRDTGDSEDGVIFRGDIGFEHQLTDTTKFVDRFLVETGSDNAYMQNDLGLEMTISGALGLRVGYQVQHNTDVQPGMETPNVDDGRPALRDEVTVS